jgi:hypothetical protein
VVLRSKNSKSEEKNVKTLKEPIHQICCHEIELNPSKVKDRAMHEGDNDSL